MSIIASSIAERGALEIIEEATRRIEDTRTERGTRGTLSYSNSVYYLPLMLGWSGKAMEKIGDLEEQLRHAQATKDLELGTLLAAEADEALRSPDGRFESPLSDAQVRGWGRQLADGRVPGVAIVLGTASSRSSASALIGELRRHNMLCWLSGGVSAQLDEESIALEGQRGVVALGAGATSAVHAFGFITRCAMQLGGLRPGNWTEIQQFGRRRVPGFLLVLGEADERTRALAQAAEAFDFPALYEEQGDLDAQSAARLVQRAFAARGVHPRDYHVDVTIPYGPAFEDEQVGDAALQFGDGGRKAFELVLIAPAADLDDGKVEVIGPQPTNERGTPGMELGIVVRLAGPRLQADFESYLERHIGAFLNFAGGVQHTGCQDEVTIRISSVAAAGGVDLAALGRILVDRFHDEFGSAVTAAEVLLVTDPGQQRDWLGTARGIYEARAQRVATLTDNDVAEFYTCMRCRSFLPDDVCIISPERISPCGGCNWFDARAAVDLHRGGPRQPIRLGRQLDAQKGIWEGTNAYAQAASHGRIRQISMYSLMESPLGACGAFQCVVMLIPEANGVMVVWRDETSPTPAGLGMETLSRLTAGDQTPGVMGIGQNYLLSSRFISAEGGFRRVVWMSSRLKESMSAQLQAVCEREGEPDLLSKIADDRQVTSAAELLTWLREHEHPVLKMPRVC